MALELKQNIKLSQQLLMTPQLQLAIKLLQLSRLELNDFIQEQLLENPLLEEVKEEFSLHNERVEDEGESSELLVREISDITDSPKASSEADVDWELLSSYQDKSFEIYPKGENNENYNYENFISSSKHLSDYLYEQILEINLSLNEQAIARLLIGNINQRGYLDLELAAFCEKEQLDLSLVEGVLDSLQRLQPPGIAARDLKECLLIQLREKHLRNGLVEKIVGDCFNLLMEKKKTEICKTLKITPQKLAEQLKIIEKLDPYPARDFEVTSVQTIIPDIYVKKIGGKWLISLNEDTAPDLRVNSYYKELGAESMGREKVYIQEKIKSAVWLIRSIQQRQRTIYKVAKVIVERQVDFLEFGVSHLRPMVLKDVANEIGMHESTVSRVTLNKYIHTPRGVFELKFFFNSSISSATGGLDLANESVRAMLKKLIKEEDRDKPYSDQHLVAILQEKGVSLARRTVAKYREQLGILPSSKRRGFR